MRTFCSNSINQSCSSWISKDDGFIESGVNTDYSKSELNYQIEVIYLKIR